MNQFALCRFINNARPLWLLLLLVAHVAGGTTLEPRSVVAKPPALRSSAAQEKETSSSKESDEQERANVMKLAIERPVQSLYQAHEIAKGLPDPVDRVRSYTAIAEAIWEHDQPLARDLFRRACEEANAVPKQRLPAKGPWPPNPRSRIEVRQEALYKVSNFDPALAIDLAKSVEPKNGGKEEENQLEREIRQKRGSERSQALMGVARTLEARKEFKRASEAATTTLSEGVTQDFIYFIKQLRQVDRMLAEALFDRALEVALRNSPPLLYELIPLSDYVDLGIPLWGARMGVRGKPSPVDPAQRTRYLNVLLERV